ncbi:unnamed protein product [Camellia sinensis]
MAKANKTTTFLFNLLLAISIFLMISVAESRIFGFGFEQQAAPNCDTVYGVEIGDTCFSVTQQFNLTTEFFAEINPNLVCDKVFVGQWLCIVGSAN